MTTGNSKVILVACGRAVATSALVAEAIREAMAARGIEVDTVVCRTAELPRLAPEASLVVSTAAIPDDLGIPVVTTLAFLTGMGIDSVVEQIVDHLTAHQAPSGLEGSSAEQ